MSRAASRNTTPLTGSAMARRAGAMTGSETLQGINTLLLLMLSLMVLGLLMMSSASVEIASTQYGDPLYFAKRQLFFSLLGIAVVVVSLQVPLRYWYHCSAWLLLLTFLLLVLVLVPGIGHVVNGSARWIDLGFYTLQPSEMAKVFLIIYLAAFLQRRRVEVRDTWSGFIKPIMVLGLFVALLHFQPDHGAMALMLAITFGMLFLAGARLHRFLFVLFLGVAGIVALAIMKPYVIRRLSSFLNPWAEEYVYGEGYQLTQALIAFGRGEWFGAGLGNSIQKLYFLPEAHTDFVVAIIAEELGLFGVMLVLALFSMLILQALRLGRQAEREGHSFSAYVAYGIAVLFASQVFINIGVNTGLLPTKGLTLPFLSYGGNSLLVSCFMVGLLLRIQYEIRTGKSGPEGEPL